MFFILSKLLNFLLMPVIWIIVAFLLGLIGKNEKRKKWFIWISFILLIIFTNPFLSNFATKKLEMPYRQISEINKVYDYGIVLGGMAQWDLKYQRLRFEAASDRLEQAVYLYKTGRIRKFLLSGGSGSTIKPDDKEMRFIKDYMLAVGIPDSAMVVESNSRNTHENAQFVAEIMKGQQASYLLITSAFHMRRAAGCFKKVGIKVLTWPVDRISTPDDEQFNIQNILLPSSDCLSNWSLILKEVIGYWVYRVMGYC
jgi:uncharacterized SAM-binding protein YcdF (DUF218 family)